MEPELREEVQRLVASARACVDELWEEGVEEFDALPTPAQPVAPRPAERPAPPVASPRSNAATEAPRAPAPPQSTPEPPRPQPLSTRTLEQVREQLGECTRCGLCEDRNSIVFGDGNPAASLMFVGEGPGEQEDKRGLPFVGRAGELLTQMIEKGLGIARSDVYICNIVKCRPPGNRTPLPNEVASCKPFLDGQIAAIQPRVIVALGKPATSLLLGRDVAITRVRGTWQEYRGIPVMPTFHPAFVLRQYTPENRRKVWEDLKQAQLKTQE